MHNRVISFFVSTLLIVGMAACSQKPEAVPQRTESSANPTTPAPDGVITVAPRELTSCDIGSAVNISWNLATKYPSVGAAEIWVGSSDAALTLFAAVGPFGEATTGPWAAPGMIIALRDKANGNELGRVVMGGPACN